MERYISLEDKEKTGSSGQSEWRRWKHSRETQTGIPSTQRATTEDEKKGEKKIVKIENEVKIGQLCRSGRGWVSVDMVFNCRLVSRNAEYVEMLRCVIAVE